MQHDFFTPQVVKDADIYLYRWIFHNWDDEKCIEILRNTIPALKKGARILINDGCLPVSGQGRVDEEKMTRHVDFYSVWFIRAREREKYKKLTMGLGWWI
jgi:O-methyltransferase domain